MKITDKYVFIEPDKVKIICDECGSETISKAKYSINGKIIKWIEKLFEPNLFSYGVEHPENPRWTVTKYFMEDKKAFCLKCNDVLKEKFKDFMIENESRNTLYSGYIKTDFLINKEKLKTLNKIKTEKNITIDKIIDDAIELYIKNMV